MDKVSIVVPIYNVEKYLRECVDSILAQTYENLQIILVDDGSPDNCGAICDDYARSDERVTVLHCENGGLSVARNRGYELCQGKYILFVDSDDYLEKNAIEVLCTHMEHDNLDMLFYDALSFDDTNDNVLEAEINKYVRKNDYSDIRNGACLFLDFLKNDEYRSPVQYCLFKKAFIDEYKLTFHKGILHEDEEFMFLSLLYAQRTKHIGDILYHHRFRFDSIMGAKTSKKNTDGCYEIFRVLLESRGEFLCDVTTKLAFETGLARLVEIMFSRARASVDKDNPQTKKQIKYIKSSLKELDYLDSEIVKTAALDKKYKEQRRKKIKIRLYKILAPMLRLIKRK